MTTWNYDPARGFLLNKRYADSPAGGGQAGPAYTYKPSGRLLTRTWARGIVTTYAYNAAGETAGATYSDSTPATTFTYDRLGRLVSKSDGIGTCTYSYQGATPLVTAETHSSGALAGLSVSRGYDSLLRQNSLTATNLPPVAYGYDTASRLQTITAGANTATYAYEPNSPLVGSTVFKNSGTTRLTSTKAYDKLNRLTSIANLQSPISNPSATTSHAYTFNAANQRIGVVPRDEAW